MSLDDNDSNDSSENAKHTYIYPLFFAHVFQIAFFPFTYKFFHPAIRADEYFQAQRHVPSLVALPHSGWMRILLSCLPASSSSSSATYVAHIDALAPRDEHVARCRCSLICIHVGAYVMHVYIHVMRYTGMSGRAERVKAFVFLSFLPSTRRATVTATIEMVAFRSDI